MLGFNCDHGERVDTQVVEPSVRWVSTSPAAIESKTTVIYITRNGEFRGRFDIPGTKKGEHAILMCLDGATFRQMMIDHAVPGTWVEISRPDKTIFKYRYLG